MRLSDRLVEVRKQLGLTQETMAEQMGVTRQSISKWETGESIPDLLRLMQMADIFDISLDALCGREVLKKTVTTVSVDNPEESITGVQRYKDKQYSKKAVLLAVAFTGIILLGCLFALLIKPKYPLSPAFWSRLNSIMFSSLFPKIMIPAVCSSLAAFVLKEKISLSLCGLLTLINVIGYGCFRFANDANYVSFSVFDLLAYSGELVFLVGEIWFATVLVHGFMVKKPFIWIISIIGLLLPIIIPVISILPIRETRPAFILAYISTIAELLLFVVLTVFDWFTGRKKYNQKEIL